ncbi:MAG TPA: hypothetical protein VKA55_03210, partial [Gammaproteobacteria bacterium]|nr:hypothetical protein [Gammaproteobacteria bacterium]
AQACGLAAEAAPAAELVGTAAEARRFVDRSGIDGLRLDLAPGHSGGGNRKGRLDYNRLKQVDQTLGSPLSVDPGEDLSEDQYHRLIRHGVAAIACRIRLPQAAGDEGGDPLAGLADAVAAEAERRMRVWGAAGRAAEVLAQCTPWEGAEQVLLCNFPEAPEGGTEAALARGEELLGRIPGVREAAGMAAASDDAPYRYAWRVRLCHSAALASFQEHPDRAALANGGVHPGAQGCTGIPYRRIPAGTAAASPSAEASAAKVAALAPGHWRNPA